MRPSFRPYFLSRPAFFMTPVRFWRGQSLRNVFILFFFYSLILGLTRRKPYTLKHRLLKTVLAEIIWYHAPFILLCQKQFPDQVGWRVFSFSLWTKKAPWKGAWERGLLRTKKKGKVSWLRPGWSKVPIYWALRSYCGRRVYNKYFLHAA